MKKFILFYFLFLICVSLKSQGLIFNKDSFLNYNKIENNRAALKTSNSLEIYAPEPYPQNGSTCVAHAFTNARSILLAKKLNITNKASKNLLLFSPYFIYYNNKNVMDNSCSDGLSIEKTASFVLNNGFCPISKVEYPLYYPFSSNKLCSQFVYPYNYSEDLKLAQNYKVDHVYRIESIQDIKIALSNDMPIVLGMAIPESFTNCSNSIWTPKYTDNVNKSYAHALTVVGFDDFYFGGAIRIMNSWGNNWGDNGFVWVKYSDLKNWVYGGFALSVESLTRGNSTNNNVTDEEITNTIGKDSITSLIAKKIISNKRDSINNVKILESDTILKIIIPEQKKNSEHNSTKFLRIFEAIKE